VKGHRADRTPMHELVRRRLSDVSQWRMPLKGTRDKVFVVFHPPYEMATNSFLTIHGSRSRRSRPGRTVGISSTLRGVTDREGARCPGTRDE
jgi:hypothetical protein